MKAAASPWLSSAGQMPDPLPQFEASLSKYFRVEDHFALVESISHDTPEAELRARFDTDLYVTARARYLIVKDKVVYRDKLIDLIHEEGKFTERVKMVMYFLFMFRDPRYRQFPRGIPNPEPESTRILRASC